MIFAPENPTDAATWAAVVAGHSRVHCPPSLLR